MRYRILTIVIALWGTLLLECGASSNADLVGSGSETVYGRLVDSTGSSVEGVEVVLSAQAPEKDSVLDTAWTNAQGGYAFSGVKGGTYGIIAWNAARSLTLMRSDLTYSDPKVGLDVGTDTLRMPGGLRARIVSGNRPIIGAFCYLRRTSFFDVSDSSGIVFESVPPGTYLLRIQPPLPYAQRDTLVTVLPGIVAHIGDISVGADPSLNPPPVRSITVTYDTARAMARVVWTPVDVDDLLGYRLYRRVNASPLIPLQALISDTLYNDNLAAFVGDTVVYSVFAVDRDLAESDAASPPVGIRIVSPELVRTTFQFTRLDSIRTDDTIRLVVSYANSRRMHLNLFWYVDHPESLLVSRSISARQGTDTLQIKITDTLAHTIFVAVIDERGDRWRDSVRVDRTGPLLRPGMWTRLSDAPCGGPIAVCRAVGGAVYVVGRDLSQSRTYALFAYHPSIDEWIKLSPLPTNRQGVAAAILSDFIYVAGGQTISGQISDIVEAFSLRDSTWSTPASLPMRLMEPGLVAAANGLWLLGGATGPSGPDKTFNSIYHNFSGDWALADQGLKADRHCFGTALSGDTIIALGGLRVGSTVPISAVDKIIGGQQVVVQSLLPLPVPRSGVGAACINGRIYAVGGTSADSVTGVVSVLDPRAGGWFEAPSLKVARTRLGVFYFKGVLYAVGGEDHQHRAAPTVEAFVPAPFGKVP